MHSLVLNQFTRDLELEDLQGSQITSIQTQSVYSSSVLNPGSTYVGSVLRVNDTSFLFEFTNGSSYLVENGLVYYE